MSESRKRVEDTADGEGLASRSRKLMILEAREAVDEREDEVTELVAAGAIEPATGRELLHRSVCQYLRRIEPLLSTESLANSTYVYQAVPVGTLQVDPPEPDLGEMWEVLDEPQPITREFTGLREVLEFEPFSHEWQIQVHAVKGGFMTRRGELETRVLSRRVCLKRPQLMRAVRLADEFLQNAGVGLGVKEASETAESDYEDVVDVDLEFSENHD